MDRPKIVFQMLGYLYITCMYAYAHDYVHANVMHEYVLTTFIWNFLNL